MARIVDYFPQEAGGDQLTAGESRLAMAMWAVGTITLRPASAGDEALLLRWANDPQVRAKLSRDLIQPLDHKWFRDRLADNNCLLLIAMAPDGCPLGQIRFDRSLLLG